jgi:hypothetical protein
MKHEVGVPAREKAFTPLCRADPGAGDRQGSETLLAGLSAVPARAPACPGIYGVIPYGVAARRTAAGVFAAPGAGRRLDDVILGVGARDPATIGAVAVALLVVAAAACWIPSRRASRIDPAIALRYE